MNFYSWMIFPSSTMELYKKPFVFMLPSFIREARKFIFISAAVFNVLLFLLISCIVLIKGDMPVGELADAWILPPTGTLLLVAVWYMVYRSLKALTIPALLFLIFSHEVADVLMVAYNIFIVRFPLLTLLIDLVSLFLLWRAFDKRDFLRNAYLFLNKKKNGSYQKAESGIVEQYFIAFLRGCRIANIRNTLGVIYELPLFASVSSLMNIGMFFVLIPLIIFLFSGYFIENKKDIDYVIPVLVLSGIIWGACTHHLFKFKFFSTHGRKEKPKVVISASLVITSFLCILILGFTYFVFAVSPYMPEIRYQGHLLKFSCPLNYTMFLLPLFIFPVFGILSLIARILSPQYQHFVEILAAFMCFLGFVFFQFQFPDVKQFVYLSPVLWIFFLILLNAYYASSDLAVQGEEKLQ